MNTKGNRQYVSQEELDRIKQLPVKTAVFARGRFTGFYDEETTCFYVMDQYGRLTGAVAQVSPEKFTSSAPVIREDTVGEYMAKRAIDKAGQEQPASPSSTPSVTSPSAAPSDSAPDSSAQKAENAEGTDGMDVQSQDEGEEFAGKRSATVFQKKKRHTGLVVGLIAAGVVLLAAGVVAAQYFGVLHIFFLDPVSDMLHSAMI